MHATIRWFAATMGIVALGLPLEAQNRDTIAVRVSLPTGRPAIGTTVMVHIANVLAHAGLTDSTGTARIILGRASQYRITAVAVGYEPAEVLLNSSTDSTTGPLTTELRLRAPAQKLATVKVTQGRRVPRNEWEQGHAGELTTFTGTLIPHGSEGI